MRKLLVALGATFVVLLGTGLYQAFRYQPTAARAWEGERTGAGDHGFLYESTEALHRYGAYVFCALVVAVILVWILRQSRSTRATLIAVVVLTVLSLAALAEVITGRDIRWDQLALSVVRPGSDIRGVTGFGAGVKYVLAGNDELASSEFSTRVFLHLVVFPVGLLVCGAVLWFLSVRDDRRNAPLGGSTDAPDGHPEDTDLAPDVTEVRHER